MSYVRLLLFAVLGITLSYGLQGVRQQSGLAVTNRQPPPLDSVVLERTRCFGPCPAYRLVIDGQNVTHFISLGPVDSGRTDSGPATLFALQKIYQLMLFSYFRSLPDTIQSSPLCGPRASDYPTATTGIYGHAIQKRVVHYEGCRWSPGILTDLESAIDSLANSSRWVRMPEHWSP